MRSRIAAVATMVAAALTLAACGGSSEASDTTSSQAPAANGTSYPLTLVSPFGETKLESKPERVAVVSFVDLDIALALGVKPVTAPKFGDTPPDEWTQTAADALGGEPVKFFDSTDGTDFEAIAASEPDVILATSGWTLEEDFPKLSKIAPIVSFEGKDGLTSMTWQERTTTVAAALGLKDKGQEVVDGVAKKFADAKAANPQFGGKSYTYAVVHPQQITYQSHAGSDTSFFTDLGFTLPAQASNYSEEKNAVSKENIDELDADILLVGYPFGAEGLLSKDDLEKDKLFTSLGAVEGGHYAVLDDTVASPLAYPTPLSQPWVLDKVVPLLATAVAGSGK